MSKVYVWMDGKDRFYTGKGWTKDIGKAEFHRKKSPVKNSKEREVEVTIAPVL